MAPGLNPQDQEAFTSFTSRKLLFAVLGICAIAWVTWPSQPYVVSDGETDRGLSYSFSTVQAGERTDRTQSALTSIIHQLTVIQQQLHNSTEERHNTLIREEPHLRVVETPVSDAPPAGADDPIIWVCTMVQDEMPYVVEWIEHLSSQGISSIMIFDDHSTDGIRYLPAFYQAHHPEVDVRVFKHDYSKGQEQAWQRCREMALARKAKWVIVCDVDEYWWSPNHGTIKEFIKYVDSQEPEITQVRLNQARFGAGAITERYQYQLVLDSDNAKEGCTEPTWSDPEDKTDGPVPADTNACPLKLINPAGIQLITENLVRRSPSLLLDEKLAVEALERQFSEACAQEWTCAPRIDHKAMWRVDACDSVFVHECRTLTRGQEITASIMDLRGNHFYTRTKADAYLHAEKWNKDDPIRFYEKANDFHTSILDVGLRTISGPIVRKRIENYLGQ